MFIIKCNKRQATGYIKYDGTFTLFRDDAKEFSIKEEAKNFFEKSEIQCDLVEYVEIDNKTLVRNVFFASEQKMNVVFRNTKNNPHKSLNHSLFERVKKEDIVPYLQFRFDENGIPYNTFVEEVCLFIMLCKRHNKFLPVVGKFLVEKGILTKFEVDL